MTPQLTHDLAALETLTAAQLRQRYQALFGEPSRSGNRRWLFRRCAWRLQALAEGNLPARLDRLRATAQRIANDADLRVIPPRSPVPDPGAPRQVRPVALRPEDRLPVAGTVLERVFKGRTCLVTVLPEGFAYDGRIYKSLTAVAFAISGSHWNGFHFFKDCLNYTGRTPRPGGTR